MSAKDGCLLLEHPCYHCRTRLIAVFHEGILVRFRVATNDVTYIRPSLNDFILDNFDDVNATHSEFLRQFPPNLNDIDYFVGECPHCNMAVRNRSTTRFLFMRNGQNFTGSQDIREFAVGSRNGFFPMK